jgi:hypothetical protein
MGIWPDIENDGMGSLLEPAPQDPYHRPRRSSGEGPFAGRAWFYARIAR